MDVKERAYNLHKSGLSYKQIGDKLGISKTASYEHVKEEKLIREKSGSNAVPNVSELQMNDRSERQIRQKEPPETINHNMINGKFKIKEFTGDELLEKKFDILEFEGKFLELIGKPSKIFHAIVWGLPKGGKSNFAIRFADYLREYFGKVVYIAAEEGESVTLQEKFKDIGGSKVTIIESRNRDDIREYLKSKDYNFAFIDSINNAGIDSEYLEQLKKENPLKSFIAIVQATKQGNFKGDQSLTHNSDFIIMVSEGVAHHHGRFNVVSEVKIFDEPLYYKNTNKIEENNPIEESSNFSENITAEDTFVPVDKKIEISEYEVLPVKKTENPFNSQNSVFTDIRSKTVFNIEKLKQIFSEDKNI